MEHSRSQQSGGPRKWKKTLLPGTPPPNGRVVSMVPLSPCAKTVTGEPDPVMAYSIAPSAVGNIDVMREAVGSGTDMAAVCSAGSVLEDRAAA